MAGRDASPSARRRRRAGGDVTAEQPRTPYLDAVVSYAFRGAGRWHVPGHKGGTGADPGLRHAIGDRALAADVPQDIRGIDVGPSPTPYEQAEMLAAEAHGAARTWFLTNGATQGNHALTLALAPLGAPVVVQRNAHASVVDGLVLSGGRPTFVAPEYDEPLGMAHGVTPDSLRAALERGGRDRVRAAFIVSPTYYGVVADVAACAQVAHDAGVALVVDQAWGGHFGFHPDLPASALQLGADAVLTSTHKMAGSMTQSAMLHVGPDSRVDIDALGRAVRLVRSTSPSSLLLGSLDAARRQLAMHGEAMLHDTLAALRAVHDRLRGIEGIALVGEELIGRPGVAGLDPLRITLDVRGTGRSGFAVADALRRRYDIHPELATHAVVVLVVGPGESAAALDRLVGDLDETVKDISAPGRRTPVVRSPLHGEAVAAVSPRDAFLGEAEVVDVDVAVGRISCESIAGYPPGIPALLPGEEITAETVRYLRELVADGARLHGASDPSFRQVTVLAAR